MGYDIASLLLLLDGFAIFNAYWVFLISNYIVLENLNEKILNPSSRHFNNMLFELLLYFNLVNSSVGILLELKFSLKIIIVMIFWMSVVTGIIFGINSLIKLPDEITGPAFFLGIGMAISSTINYYK